MKICILGIGKSGTTALLFKVAGGLPHCYAFSGGKPGKYSGNYKNAVYKHTYSERKGKSFGLFKEHFFREQYDKKIWITRDPRDVSVSQMLYCWHRGYGHAKEQYQTHLNLVLKKEKDPRSIPFYEVCRYARHESWPMSKEAVINEEKNRYVRMTEFVQELGDEWFLFKYEDMVDGRFDALQAYLGFDVKQEEEVPTPYGKVIRKKKCGDWRHWFTDEDIRAYKPAFAQYMEITGYNLNDWELSSNPIIEPEYSSQYMQSLPGRVTRDTFLRYVYRILRFMTGKA